MVFFTLGLSVTLASFLFSCSRFVKPCHFFQLLSLPFTLLYSCLIIIFIFQVWQAFASLFPVAIYSLLALLTPQSPRWLVSRGLSHEARSCLQKLRKTDYNINRELQEYEDACSETMGPSGSRWTKVLYGGVSDLAAAAVAAEERAIAAGGGGVAGAGGGGGGGVVGGTVVGNGVVGGREHQPHTVWKPLFITLGLMVAQQFSGINSMIFNMESIFISVGFNDNKKAAIIIGATQVVATLFSVLLIDNIGRRKLLMISALGETKFIFVQCKWMKRASG